MLTDVIYQNSAMSALAAGGTDTMTASHTFTEGGTYYVRVCADDGISIQESDEGNNC